MKHLLRGLGGICILSLLLSAPLRADLIVGSGARSAGMAGAGLAILDNPTDASLRNPAALALQNRGNFFRFPSLSFQNQGIGFADMIRRADAGRSLSSDNAIDIASDLLGDKLSLGMDANMGLGLGPLVIEADGEAVLKMTPDEGLMNWIHEGGAGNPPLDSTVKLEGGMIYSLPSVSLSHRFISGNSGKGFRDISAGVRVRMLHARFRQEVVCYDGEGGATTIPTQALSQSESGMSADLGLILQSPGKKTQMAVLVENLLEPKLDFLRQERTIDLGIAQKLLGGGIFAADVRNLTGAYGRHPIAAAGIEYPLGRFCAVRAGLSTRGTALGLSVGPFSFAYAGRGPLFAEDMLRD